MAITTLDQYIASAKQNAPLMKTATRTAVAATWYSVFDLAGNPGAGALAGVDASAGVVPTDLVAGYPTLNAFGGGALGYLSKVDFGSSVACRIALFDRLYVAGAFPFNAATSLAGQPSYVSRLPGGDYKGLEIWAEQVTAATLNQTWNVQYTNENGTTGRTTGAVGVGAAPAVGRCWQLPLQTGDLGVRTIDAVTGGTGSAGTANIMVLRPLWTGRVRIPNDGDVHDFLKTGLPQIYSDSALYMLIAPDSTATAVPELRIEIANG